MPAVVNLLPLAALRLPVHIPAPPPIHHKLPHFNRNTLTRRICTRSRRALENVWACLEIAWVKLQNIWNAARRKPALSTWLAISISIIVGGLGLTYAYVQVVLRYEALKLAKWTARKDFWDLCREQEVCRLFVMNHVA